MMVDEDKLIRGLAMCMKQEIEFLPSYGRIYTAAQRFNPAVDTFIETTVDNSPEQIEEALEHSRKFRARMGWK